MWRFDLRLPATRLAGAGALARRTGRRYLFAARWTRHREEFAISGQSCLSTIPQNSAIFARQFWHFACPVVASSQI